MDKKFSRLTRPLQQMPDYVRQAIESKGLAEDYSSRPAYQQNDYLDWISRAVKPETKQKRLDQMLEELRKGDFYMNMQWNPGKLPGQE